MLKELLKFPFFAFFQPKELESKLNEKTGGNRLLIWIHILILPILFCINFLTIYTNRQFLFPSEVPLLYIAFLILIIAVGSYAAAISVSFFVSGLFKKDNLTSFIIGTYWSFLFNLFSLSVWYIVRLLQVSYRYPTAGLDEEYFKAIQIAIFLSCLTLFLLLFTLIINIYGKTKQFWIVVFVICIASIIINYLIAIPVNSNRVNFFFIRDETANRKYIFIIYAPIRKNNLWSFLPSTYIETVSHLLVDVKTGHQTVIQPKNRDYFSNIPKDYNFKAIYTLDENTLKSIETYLLKTDAFNKRYFKQEVREYLKEIKKIELYADHNNYSYLEDQLLPYLRQLSLESEYNDSDIVRRFYIFGKDEEFSFNQFVAKFINKFNKEIIINLPIGTYKLDDQDANNFNQFKGRPQSFLFKNLKISVSLIDEIDKRNDEIDKRKIRIENKSNNSIEKIPGEEIITFIPLENDRIFLQTDLGYQFVDANSGRVLEQINNEGWYPDSSFNLQYNLQSTYLYTDEANIDTENIDTENTNTNINVYKGNIIYSLSPSGYLVGHQTYDGQLISPRQSIYADDISPFKNKSFYYVIIYYIFVGIIVTYLGFYRIPIYIFESVTNVVCTVALSLGWISPNLSTRFTPLFFEHISTISFPFSRYYLHKLFRIAPNLCTDSLIYLLIRTNQKRFAAEFSVEFFEENRNFLFEFIYKSLKFDDGKAIIAIVDNSKKDNSITDLLLSYQQLVTQSSKKPYINTHIVYLKGFVDENYKYSNEILLSYKAFLVFYTLNDLQQLAESDKPLREILKINYGELLNPQIIEMFNIIVEFAQDIKNYDIVENFRDKQYYLSEARIKLYDLSSQTREVLYEPEKSIFLEIFERWQGIITSEAKSLRGPADIALSILNKKLSVNGENEWQSIVVRVENTGLSPAENIQLSFLDNENVQILDKKKEIKLLGMGDEAKIEFSIKPEINLKSLRINIDTSFDDFERKNKLRVFADILSITSPTFEYKRVQNPYVVGIPLKDKRIFVGRNHALKFALDNLSSGIQNNVLIYFGQRRIGKSSILYQLADSPLQEEYIFVYIDCQGFADADTAILLYRICRSIRSNARKNGILIEDPTLDKFKENTFLELDDYFDKVEQSLNGKKIVLMFDEYEFLEYKVKDGKVSPDIFNKLRNLMQHRNNNFAFIFVGTHRLTELTEDYWSFLFNIALYHEIGTLDEKEARLLITKPIEGYIKYDELAIDKILRITGCHPYFIQVICRLIVNYCNDNAKGYINLKDLNEVLEAAVEGGTAHIKYLFSDYSTKPEQEILTFLSRATDETKLHASSAEITRFAIENGFAYDRASVQEILSGLKNKKLVRQGGELGELVGFEYEFLRLWIEKHVRIQKGFINIT